MITRRFTILGFVLAFGLLGSIHAADRWQTLQSIHMVENPTNSRRVGAHGELGAYQFRPATWVMYSHKPFSTALDRHESDVVAVKHYEWIKHGLENAGLEVSAYNIALAWNGGLGALLRGKTTSASHDYAERVANCMEHFRQPVLVASNP